MAASLVHLLKRLHIAKPNHQTWRTFSSTATCRKAPTLDPEVPQEPNDKPDWRDKNAYIRWRYKNEPEYRARKLAYNKEYYATHPEFRAAVVDKNSKNSHRYQTDAQYRERTLKMRNDRFANDEEYRRRHRLSKLIDGDRKKNQLRLRAHEAVWHTEKMRHTCCNCARILKRKLWFRHLANPEKLECKSCLFKGWPNAPDALPIGIELEMLSDEAVAARKKSSSRPPTET